MDNVCNRRLFSIPSKVEMAEEQEYLRGIPWENFILPLVLCCCSFFFFSSVLQF